MENLHTSYAAFLNIYMHLLRYKKAVSNKFEIASNENYEKKANKLIKKPRKTGDISNFY